MNLPLYVLGLVLGGLGVICAFVFVRRSIAGEPVTLVTLAVGLALVAAGLLTCHYATT